MSSYRGVDGAVEKIIYLRYFRAALYKYIKKKECNYRQQKIDLLLYNKYKSFQKACKEIGYH